MSGQVLLVNPTITSRRSARFPLSILSLAAALEGRRECTLIDGNLERDTVASALSAMDRNSFDAVGITVMGGPQVATAIEVSKAIRARDPSRPIVWGGYFPTLYPSVALAAPYVDYVVRSLGEQTFPELLDVIGASGSSDPASVAGLSWRRDGAIVHNADRVFSGTGPAAPLPYHRLGDPRRYLVKTFLGRRTAAHQGALGCRYRCTFCGVAAMFSGRTALPPAARLEQELLYLKHTIGADSIQFVDHNFFDREDDMQPILEALARIELPWWCYARADALIDLSASSWSLVRRSRMRMAYIGAESPSDALLRAIKKGTRAEQTLEVAELCARHGVIPELSFMVAPPDDPEGETERTFEFIREIKRINPRAEIIVYVYTPLPPDSVPARMRSKLAPLRDADGRPVRFPATPEEWTERRWVDYSCHADAPWLTDRLRRRIRDFVTILRCRFPTVQDTRVPDWSKSLLSSLASWRYHYRRYDRPWELNASQRVLRLMDPRTSSI